jgi:hypothetical protein
VSDSGQPVPADVVRNLFIAPLTSGAGVAAGGGLGIGLFQVARQARLAGYDLGLDTNEPGNVRFELARHDSGQHHLGL